jgi:hypothetical protein
LLNYSILPKEDLLKLFPNRSWDAILMRGKRTLKLERLSFRSHPNNQVNKGRKFPNVKKPKRKKEASYISGRGYKYIRVSDFKNVDSGWQEYRPEHILIMEESINRKLVRSKDGKGEGVHHLDGDKLNNNIENLFLYSNEKEHYAIHRSLDNLLFELYKKQIIIFDKNTKTYKLNGTK